MRKGKDADHRVGSGRVRPSRPAASRARHLVTVLLALALAAAGATAARAQQPGSPEEQELGRLFTQIAKQGTLKPVKGKPRFTLKLRGVAPQVVWFDDRPERQTGQMPVGGFVRSWSGFGFRAVPPNAALTLLDAKDHEDTVVLKLGNPRYDRKTRTVRYPAHVLEAATGNLSHLEAQRDERVPRRFRAASLFIDDAGYGLAAGCQPGLPYIKCTYTSSTTLSFDSMVDQLESSYRRQLGSSTPVWVQAWGGRGAKGASSNGSAGSFGGYAGYAMTVSSVGTLTGHQLYLYVGASGSYHANYSGQGGASSIVSTQPLSTITDPAGRVLVIAGGSGGGGRSCNGEASGRGGDGGVAVGGSLYYPGENGEGPQAGSGGDNASGGAGSDAGTDGAGGYGGPGSQGSSTGWVNVEAVDPDVSGWTTGAGGGGRGGGGGGGWGGGGGGGGCVVVANNILKNGGGGGGGSLGVLNRGSDPTAPIDSKQADGAQSEVVLTFNLSPS